MGNFEETQPTQAQVDALTNLLTALAKKYHIDPNATETYFQPSSTAPYVTVKTLPTIVGHGDIAATRCPGEHLHSLLPFIRSEVAKRLNESTPSQVVVREEQVTTTLTASAHTDFSTRLLKIKETQPDLLKAVAEVMRSRYKGSLPKATNTMNKLLTTTYSDEALYYFYTQSAVDVLLYDLTTKYTTLDIACEKSCTVRINDGRDTYQRSGLKLTFTSNDITVQPIGSKETFTTQTVSIFANPDISQSDLITIKNYDRKSYAGISRNTFHNQLFFQKGKYQTLEGQTKE
jgi:hypothetical protein